MKQDVDGKLSETAARAAGYIPVSEVLAVIGVGRNLRELGKTMRREGLRPVRVGHAYWWHKAAVSEWAAKRRWIREQRSAAAQCAEPGCMRDAIVHGICLMHYKRLRGDHADTVSRAGKPVGAGVYGHVAEDEVGRLVCHECGGAYWSLAAHVLMSHGMSAAEYREIYELPRSMKLVAARIRERTGQRATSPENLARLTVARNPQAAADARTDETFKTISRSIRARHNNLNDPV